MDWCDHPIASAEDDLLVRAFQCFDNRVSDYAPSASVCRAWNRAVVQVTRERGIYRFGECHADMRKPEDLHLVTLPDRIMTRSAASRFRARRAEVSAASRVPTCCAWYPTHTGFFAVGFASGELMTYSSRMGYALFAYPRLDVLSDTLPVPMLAVTHVAFSSDGTWGLACYANGSTMTFRPRITTDGKLSLNCDSFHYCRWNHALTWGEFVPNSELLAVCGSSVTVTHRSPELMRTYALWQHTEGALSTRFSPEGKTSATLTSDGLRIHCMSTRTELMRIEAPHAINTVWSPDGSHLLVGSTRASSFVIALATLQVKHASLTSSPAPVCWSHDGRHLFFPGHVSAWLGVDAWLDGRAHGSELVPTLDIGDISFSPDLHACVCILNAEKGGQMWILPV